MNKYYCMQSDGQELGPGVARALMQVCSAKESEPSAAVKLFKEFWPGAKYTRPDRLLRRWQGRGTLIDAPRPGAPCKVAPILAGTAAVLFTSGWVDKHGQTRGFRNVAHAKEMSEAFRLLVSKVECCDRTLLRAMVRADPAVARVPQVVKPLFREDVRKQRQRTAGKLLRLALCILKATEWTDEGSWGFGKMSMKVYGTRGCERVVAENRAPRQLSEINVLHFAIVVNWHKGPHNIVFLTGTKQLKQDEVYKVWNIPSRAGVPQTISHTTCMGCRPCAQPSRTPQGHQCSM